MYIMDQARKPVKDVPELKGGLNLPKHMAEHAYMFSGKSSDIILAAKKHLMSELIDWFGRDFRILEESEDDLKIRVRCNESAMRYIALQYGPYMEVLAPESIRGQIIEDVAGMFEKYGKEKI